MKMKLLRGYFRAKGLLEDFAKEERCGRHHRHHSDHCCGRDAGWNF